MTLPCLGPRKFPFSNVFIVAITRESTFCRARVCPLTLSLFSIFDIPIAMRVHIAMYIDTYVEVITIDGVKSEYQRITLTFEKPNALSMTIVTTGTCIS